MPSKLLIAAGLALAVAPSISTSPAAAAKPCAHAGGATMLRPTARVSVYRTPGSELGARIYACWRPTGRTMLLHANTGGAAVTDVIVDRRVAVAGRVVAFHVFASGDRNYDYVRSFDVRTGRRLRSSGIVDRPTGILPQPLPPSAIATNSRGAIVWLASGVLRVTDGENTRAVATTVPGPITGVAATAGQARWTQGGARHHNPLA
jgi:hypothetical protein